MRAIDQANEEARVMGKKMGRRKVEVGSRAGIKLLIRVIWDLPAPDPYVFVRLTSLNV